MNYAAFCFFAVVFFSTGLTRVGAAFGLTWLSWVWAVGSEKGLLGFGEQVGVAVARDVHVIGEHKTEGEAG